MEQISILEKVVTLFFKTSMIPKQNQNTFCHGNRPNFGGCLGQPDRYSSKPCICDTPFDPKDTIVEIYIFPIASQNIHLVSRPSSTAAYTSDVVLGGVCQFFEMISNFPNG